MHRLTDIELNFNCSTLARAQWFNDSAEQLWQQELLPVAQQVLDEFDVAAGVQLEEICLQLPPLCLPADRYLLQHSFRQALRTQLWLLLPHATSKATQLQQQLSAAQRNALINALKTADTAALTLHWPLYRRFASELVAILRQLAASGDICTVLAFGLSSEMLAGLVQLLAPTEQRFVLQLMAQPQLFAITPARLSGAARQQLQLPAPALRQRQRHLWQLSLSYLLVERGSRFNRQSYLHYLLRRMAAHDNVSLQSLVQHMLLTLAQRQRYFAAQSPLLLQLTELLQPLLAPPQPDKGNNAAAPDLAYSSPQRALAGAVLPEIQRHSAAQRMVQQAEQQTQLSPARRWQQWQYLLRQNRLTLAQQRQFNALLQQLLQQNSGLWLDQLRQQLQQLSLLPSLVQYAQPELLQRLFQQLQPASVAAISPYIRLLHWALAAISLPLPLQQHARWQPLLQCALQRQPLTLNLLLLQLQLWLQAQQGAVAGRQTLQQLAGQLQYYGGTEVLSSAASTNSSQSQVARLWQQLQWQLAVTAPWATTVRPLLSTAVVVAQHAATTAVANHTTVRRSSAGRDLATLSASATAIATQSAKQAVTKAPGRLIGAAAGPLWQQLVQLLVQALPASVQQQAQQLCQQVVAQCLPAVQRLPLLTSASSPVGSVDGTAAQRHSTNRPRRNRQAYSPLDAEPDIIPGSAAGNIAASVAGLFSNTLLNTLAATLAPASSQAFYCNLRSKLQHSTAGQARNLLLRQLQRLLAYVAPEQNQLMGTIQHDSSGQHISAGQEAGRQSAGRQAQAAQTQALQRGTSAATETQQSQTMQTGKLEPEIPPPDTMQLVNNAGLVLAAPYLPLLWQRLGWLEAQRFSCAQHAWQACALLHYMATGETAELLSADYWQQWRLGMLLSGLQPPCPHDVDISLSTAQLELADSLLAGILAQWPKLANSSTDTLRECFLQRAGSLSQLGNGSGWQLQLDSGPYDMLLDGLPWSFSLICYPWMQGELYVHWRG